MAALSFLDNPQLKSLVAAFNTFAAAHSNDNVDMRVLRSLAAGTKATIDQALTEFPQDYITSVVQDIYALPSSPEVAESISATVQSFDKAKIHNLVEGLKVKLKHPETSLKTARQVKGLLTVISNTAIKNLMNETAGRLPGTRKMMSKLFFSQFIEPKLDQLRKASDAVAAKTISELADKIPSKAIAEIGAALTSRVTPAFVSQVAQQAVDHMLPPPAAIAMLVHWIGESASETLGEVVKSTTSAQAIEKLQAFTENASTLAYVAMLDIGTPAHTAPVAKAAKGLTK